MTEPRICPDCGHRNPAEATSCERCNFPLGNEAGASPEAARPVPDPGAAAAAGTAAPASTLPASSGGVPTIPRPARRPPRPRAMAGQSVSLWLLFGTFCAVALIYTAVKANIDRAHTPVEGAEPNQQQRVDELRDRLAKDSTDTAAHVALGNVLYDTRNWPDAIVEYRAALRRDSTQASVMVDLGVCYYNLGESREAERLFQQALRHDPHQPIALFNLGIVSEQHEQYDLALQYYHRALESSPPDEIQPTLVAAMQRVQQKTGRAPKPLPDGVGAK
jgi:cytochrome c-type biogenesis protein CcmH/NrfG